MADLIFDMDGTLSDPSHRRHLVQGKKRNYHAFNDLCGEDPPHHHTCMIARSLCDVGHRLIVVSARPQRVWRQTYLWLAWVAQLPAWDIPIYLRADRDNRPDAQVKRDILDRIRTDGYCPLAVFDDRTKAVEMWRGAGIPCFQVSNGDF